MSNIAQPTISHFKKAVRHPKYTVSHMVDDLKQSKERGIVDAATPNKIIPELPDASMYF